MVTGSLHADRFNLVQNSAWPIRKPVRGFCNPLQEPQKFTHYQKVSTWSSLRVAQRIFQSLWPRLNDGEGNEGNEGNEGDEGDEGGEHGLSTILELSTRLFISRGVGSVLDGCVHQATVLKMMPCTTGCRDRAKSTSTASHSITGMHQSLKVVCIVVS